MLCCAAVCCAVVCCGVPCTAVLYPKAPLLDATTGRLTTPCVKALLRIFLMCGFLSRVINVALIAIGLLPCCSLEVWLSMSPEWCTAQHS
jgi:hypothetical protein